MYVFIEAKAKEGVTFKDMLPLALDEMKVGIGFYKEKIVKEFYIRQDCVGAVVIMHVSSVEKAKEELYKLPIIKHDLVDYTFIPTEKLL